MCGFLLVWDPKLWSWCGISGVSFNLFMYLMEIIQQTPFNMIFWTWLIWLMWEYVSTLLPPIIPHFHSTSLTFLIGSTRLEPPKVLEMPSTTMAKGQFCLVIFSSWQDVHRKEWLSGPVWGWSSTKEWARWRHTAKSGAGLKDGQDEPLQS